MDLSQEKAIKEIQLNQQKQQLAKKRVADINAKQRALQDQRKVNERASKQFDDLLAKAYSSYFLSCLNTLNLNPIKNIAIILGTLGILADKIQSGKASTEIDDAIQKYKQLVAKGLIKEAKFDESESEDNSQEPAK